jgi:major membrane immunogen (membrane-anchored lipoprotein)
MRTLLALFAVFVSSTCFADKWQGTGTALITGKVYEQNTDKKHILFTFEKRIEVTDEQRNVQVRYFLPDGKVAVEEKVHYEKGDLKKYTMDQFQINEFGSMDVHDGKMWFSYKQRNGKVKKDDEQFVPDKTIVVDQIVESFLDQWDFLMNGGELRARVGILSRCETVAFKFFKEKEVMYNGRKAVVIKMKPSAFVISMIVKPITFTFDLETHKPFEVDGRMPVKRFHDGDDYSDWDGTLVFDKIEFKPTNGTKVPLEKN